LYSGITKVLDPEWTASGYLIHAVPEGNPFGGIWTVFARMPLVDILFHWGLTLVGLGIMLGAFTRWNAFWGSVMMLLIWASSLPLETGIIVDEHIVYIAVLIVLSTMGARHIVGLDSCLESSLAEDDSRLLYLMS
jgi:thiosulfate dehydrogenase [quinone] large subunit